MKVAFVYDRVNKWGGAERVLLSLHQIWPHAPLYTAVYDRQKASWAKVFQVTPSFLQRIPFFRTRHELIPYLMPVAFESFDFSQFDVVISVTSEFAKGIITPPKTFHLCYCLTPIRYLWSLHNYYFRHPLLKLLTSPVINYLRRQDLIAAARPDEFVAISQAVQKRIEKYYQRTSTVIYPGVNLDQFSSPLNYQSPIANYFLLVSRLVPYKRVDLPIEAFNQLNLPLKIVGVGSQLTRLKKMARPNIEFVGQLTDDQLLSYYRSCQALILPQEEDFGLVAIEAQAAGKPVIAFKGGGAVETIIEGQTGVFFEEQSVGSLIKTVQRFNKIQFIPKFCRQQAEKFSVKIFKEQFKNLVESKWRQHVCQ